MFKVVGGSLLVFTAQTGPDSYRPPRRHRVAPRSMWLQTAVEPLITCRIAVNFLVLRHDVGFFCNARAAAGRAKAAKTSTRFTIIWLCVQDLQWIHAVLEVLLWRESQHSMLHLLDRIPILKIRNAEQFEFWTNYLNKITNVEKMFHAILLVLKHCSTRSKIEYLFLSGVPRARHEKCSTRYCLFLRSVPRVQIWAEIFFSFNLKNYFTINCFKVEWKWKRLNELITRDKVCACHTWWWCRWTQTPSRWHYST